MSLTKRRKRKCSLAKESVEGRLDVLCYKLAERITTSLEEKYRVKGLWDEIEGYVGGGIVEHIGGERMEIPSGTKALLRKFGIV